MAAPLANAPRLPPEICERIMDHLGPFWEYEDMKQSLMHCALVCRGWYAASRAVLFSRPELLTRKEAMVFVRSLRQMPLLGSRVRQLVIGRWADPQTVVTGWELASILVMLAGKLPNLDTLHFWHVSFEHCSMRDLAFWSLHEFSHITSLRLDQVTLPSASPFVQVVSSFPHLQHLHCSLLRWSKSTSMAPLPQRHRMPLTTVSSLDYDMSCFEGIGHILLSLLDQAILKTLSITRSPVSAPALAFTQRMLNIAGKSLEKAFITFWEPEADSAGNVHSLLLHPISFEANVNLQQLFLTTYIWNTALFARDVLLPTLNTISSRDLKDFHLSLDGYGKWETDALLNAFDPEVCIQIDELLAEGHFPKLRDVSIKFYLPSLQLDDSRLCTEFCARFPKLFDKNMLIIIYNECQFPSDAERAFKAEQLADKQLRPAEQAAA